MIYTLHRGFVNNAIQLKLESLIMESAKNVSWLKICRKNSVFVTNLNKKDSRCMKISAWFTVFFSFVLTLFYTGYLTNALYTIEPKAVGNTDLACGSLFIKILYLNTGFESMTSSLWRHGCIFKKWGHFLMMSQASFFFILNHKISNPKYLCRKNVL